MSCGHLCEAEAPTETAAETVDMAISNKKYSAYYITKVGAVF